MRKLAMALIWAIVLPARAQAPATPELPLNKDFAALNAAAADLTGGRIAALGPPMRRNSKPRSITAKLIFPAASRWTARSMCWRMAWRNGWRR